MKLVRASSRVLPVLFAVVALATAQPARCAGQKSEEQMGREYAADLEKDVTLSKDQAAIDRVNNVGQAIAAIANQTPVPASYGSSDMSKFTYEFRVIDDRDVNALSMPGGIIYVDTGLLDLATSDDELAGVLAHEVAHAAHHHMVQLMKKSSSVDRYVALIALAGILGRARSQDLNNIVMGAQMLRIGTLSGYTQEAEKDADRTAVAYLAHSSYNPEGMLSFMRKLETKHAENPTASLGIFQTHPEPFRRVAAITQAMMDAGLKPNLRRLQDVAYAKSEQVDQTDRYRVVISKRTLYEPATIDETHTSKQRAEELATRVNTLLDSGVSPQQISQDPANYCLMVKSETVLKVEQQDAQSCGTSTTDLLRKARETLEYAVWADWLAQSCRTVTCVPESY